MSNQVFEIAPLKARAVELLRRHGGYMAAGSVAAELGVPLYAVNVALQEALIAGELQHAAGVGWRVLVPMATMAADGGGGQSGSLWGAS